MFGYGLDREITQVYEWLVENYEDNDDIYIIGFSRGANAGFADGLYRCVSPTYYRRLGESPTETGIERTSMRQLTNRCSIAGGTIRSIV